MSHASYCCSTALDALPRKTGGQRGVGYEPTALAAYGVMPSARVHRAFTDAFHGAQRACHLGVAYAGVLPAHQCAPRGATGFRVIALPD